MAATANSPSIQSQSHIEVIEVHQYYPPGVKQIISRGGWCYIGLVDESTILKYPCIPGEHECIQIENQFLQILGSHPRIIASKGLTESGLLLGYCPNGDLNNYIISHPEISIDQKLRWCKQAAEAVEYIHEKSVIHRDISLRNLLLDKDMNVLLADFQGMLKSTDGKTLLDGLSRECSKSFQPRPHGDYADTKTDIFALGSAIYFIMTGHEVFPELDSSEDEEEIALRFRNSWFPTDDHECCLITEKCWRQQYETPRHIVSDISEIQRRRQNDKGHGDDC
jgi:serine/threonine protein kinase